MTPALRFIGYQIHHLASDRAEVTTTQKDFDQSLLRTQKHVPAEVNALDLCWSTRGHTAVAQCASKRRGSTPNHCVSKPSSFAHKFQQTASYDTEKWPCFFAVARHNVIAAEQLTNRARTGWSTNKHSPICMEWPMLNAWVTRLKLTRMKYPKDMTT